MNVVYTGSSPEVVTPDGQGFPNGEPVDVSNELGESLTARSDFEAVKEGE